MEGSIHREGNLLIGEGEAGLQMYDDTMNLALSKTIKIAYFIRTAVLSLSTLVACFGAYQWDSKTISVAAGGLGVLAIQQGISAYKSRKQYKKGLEEAISHGWNSPEQLKQIDHGYL